MQSITVELPDNLYKRIRQRARERNRSVEAETTEAVALAFAAVLPPTTTDLLEQLPYLADQELWQAARMRVPDEKAERMQELIGKEQGEGLTAAENDEATQLQQYARHVMLVRARAAALLAERGHDIAELGPLSIE